ncbi:MAG: HTH domain-containing protein [Clostridiales bacterium]|jgi:biotin-(acetyl-CoA carboxylase) ligase/biotin operon repressor|nr:HTH domain-containing protein [Clostridiales bacterium]
MAEKHNTKNYLLKILEERRGQSVSGGEIAKTLSVSRSAVWQAAKSLKSDGYLIESVPNRGYTLLDNNDLISVSGIAPRLISPSLSENIRVYDVLESTNKTAKIAALDGAPHGTVIIADHQTTGKGRNGKTFYSEKSAGLYMSIILRPSALGLSGFAEFRQTAEAAEFNAGGKFQSSENLVFQTNAEFKQTSEHSAFQTNAELQTARMLSFQAESQSRQSSENLALQTNAEFKQTSEHSAFQTNTQPRQSSETPESQTNTQPRQSSETPEIQTVARLEQTAEPPPHSAPYTKTAAAITQITAAAAILAVTRVCGVRPSVRRVNDIYLDGKKISGILTEAVADLETGHIEFAVAGIGINTGIRKFPDDLKDAASVSSPCGNTRNRLAAEIINSLLAPSTPNFIWELLKVYAESRRD